MQAENQYQRHGPGPGRGRRNSLPAAPGYNASSGLELDCDIPIQWSLMSPVAHLRQARSSSRGSQWATPAADVYLRDRGQFAGHATSGELQNPALRLV